MLRKTRNKEDSWNSIAAGMVSGISLSLIKDKNTKKLVALYMMVRVGKISLDIVESKGLLSE